MQVSALSKAAGPLADGHPGAKARYSCNDPNCISRGKRFLIRLTLPVSTSSGAGERAVGDKVREETMTTEEGEILGNRAAETGQEREQE